MKHYIGQKRILAKPMTRGEYNQYRGLEISQDENPADEGYLVEYMDSPNSNHENHENYISWSPKGVFEKSYRETTLNGLTFGQAIEELKNGKRIQRDGWNGKGMFLFLLHGGNPPKTAIHDSALRAVIDEHCEGDTFRALPSIRMWTADNKVLTGWLASQGDMLSDDWRVLG